MKREVIRRGLSKVPVDRQKLYRATVRMLAAAEREVDTRLDGSNWVPIVLDLRDIRQDLEARYPVLRYVKVREARNG